MSAPAAIDMHQAAALAGIAYETFRKWWPRQGAVQGFPRPFRAQRPYAWDPDDVVAWRERRKAAALIPPANDDAGDRGRGPAHPADRPAVSRRVAMQRAQMIALMKEGTAS